MLLLGLPKGKYYWSWGYGINTSGQVAGTSHGGSSPAWFPESATIWSVSGVALALTKSGTVISEGFALNDGGDVAGAVYANGLVTGKLWQNSNGAYTEITLGTVSGYNGSNGWSINNARQVVGMLYNNGTPLESFLWLPASAYGLPSGMNRLSGFQPFPKLNNAGMIVGRGAGDHAYLWMPPGAGAAYGLADGFNDIHDGISGWVTSNAFNVNNPLPGQPIQVVGGATTDASGNEYAFVWNSASRLMHNLNDPLVTLNLPAGWVLTGAGSINAAGQIVGTGTYQGTQRSFVLTPNP